MSVLKGLTEIEILCVNSRVSFERNKNHLNAKDIILKQKQNLTLDDLKMHMDCCINDWLEQHKNESEICVSLTEFIDNSSLAEILSDYVMDSLDRHPQIENCTVGNGFIEAIKRELTETNFISSS